LGEREVTKFSLFHLILPIKLELNYDGFYLAVTRRAHVNVNPTLTDIKPLLEDTKIGKDILTYKEAKAVLISIREYVEKYNFEVKGRSCRPMAMQGLRKIW
jgi:hypothetical protein